MEEKNISISTEEYRRLQRIAEEYANTCGRLDAFRDYVNAKEYAIDREICGAILGFDVEEKVKNE